jgi:hypothetical protein
MYNIYFFQSYAIILLIEKEFKYNNISLKRKII